MPTAADRYDQVVLSLPSDEGAPVRAACAASAALSLDGAALSLHSGELHVPIGASGPEVAQAERLQFTLGHGPCLRAVDDGRSVTFDADDIARNWPELYAGLVTTTSLRAVLSVPLPEPLGPTVVLDLYARDPVALPALDREDLTAVVGRVTDELGEDLRRAPRPPFGDGAWLAAPGASRRSATWEAVCLVAVELDVDNSTALALLRATAISSDRLVDDVADDLATGRLGPGAMDSGQRSDDGR